MGEPTGKRCTGCGEVKPPSEFGRDQQRRDGLAYRCRDCQNRRKRERYAANLEVERGRVRQWRAANLDLARELTRQSQGNWAAANREAAREHSRRWYASYKDQVLDHYGRECACCGSVERLTIDHVNGDGREHRKTVKGAASGMYRWLIKNGFPDEGFQVLCHPCNTSKWTGDRCRLDHAAVAVPELPE